MRERGMPDGYLPSTSDSAGSSYNLDIWEIGRLLFPATVAGYLNSKAQNNSQYKM